MRTPSRTLLIFTVAISSLFLVLPAAHAQKDTGRLPWLDGFTLIELDSADRSSMYEARALIESAGGQVAILSPPSILMGWVPFETRNDLIGRSHIRDIYYTEVPAGEIRLRDEQTKRMVRYFNGVVSGRYTDDYLRRQMSAPPVDRGGMPPDARDRGQFEEGAYLENLENNGFDTQRLKDRGLLLEKSTLAIAGNSDRMMGTVATTLIFVESDGSGVDPDTYTWTDQHVQDYINGVNTGMAWWSARAREYNDCWVAFYVRYFAPTDPRCRQWREMVLHPSGDVAAMVSDIMANFGYTLGNALTRVDAFNSAQRATHGTDWSYTGFVAYNPAPAPNQLTDGAAAFAYRFGPYTFLLYRSYGWAPEQVFAHESGHIFGACDEYSSGCSSTSCATVCANGVVNGNCEDCALPVQCMMLANSWALCSYTDDHVGWQINPCAPSPLAPPSVSAALPASGAQGGSYTISVAGSGFLYGAWAEMGAGITVENNELVGSDTLLVSVSIDNEATPGTRTVRVYNRDMQTDALAAGFEIRESTRHYVSTTGAAVYPYVTPADAATNLSDAIAAAADGDSVLVASGTFVVNGVDLIQPLTLSGAWTGGFSGQDLNGAKTALDLNGNILVGISAGEVLIEGFVLENGTGSSSLLPASGDYGGAIQIQNSTATIRYCEIRQNSGSGGPGFSGGGGVFVSGGEVTIENSHIHDNTATCGGGVYLYNCTATLTGNLIESNTVAASTTQPAGAGIVVDQCNGVMMENNSFSANTGSQDGGGVWIANSSAVTVNGGEISRNDAMFFGAGLCASKSDVDISGVQFLRNNSGAVGGGVVLKDTCTATVSGCSFRWNSGSIGGGVYYSTGSVTVAHNLFVGNSGSGNGGGMFGGGVSGGEVTGNTLDRNSGGAMYFSDVSSEVYNNIVTNTTGHGVAGAGTVPVFTYNNVWNSSGDDYNGCAAGEGSVSGDPVFSDTALVDYHLGVHSPAIDAGRPGVSWQDPDGSRGDMGWYGSRSIVMDQPAYVKGLAADVSSGNVVLTWSRNNEPDLLSYAVYCDTAAGFVPAAASFVQFVAAPDTTVSLGTPGDTLYYIVNAVDTDGYAGGYSATAIASPPTAAPGRRRFANRLHQNVPNPFNPATAIRYELGERTRVELTVYDVGGRLVKTLVRATMPAGVYRAGWDGTNDRGARVSSGLYFYKLSTPSFSQTRKMVLLK